MQVFLIALAICLLGVGAVILYCQGFQHGQLSVIPDDKVVESDPQEGDEEEPVEAVEMEFKTSELQSLAELLDISVGITKRREMPLFSQRMLIDRIRKAAGLTPYWFF